MTSSISPGAKVVAYPPISPEWAVSATPATPNAWHPPWAKAGVRASTTVTTTKASTTTILLRMSSCTSFSVACEEGRLEKPRPYFGSPLRIGARRGPGLLYAPAFFLFALLLAGRTQFWVIVRRPWSGANNALWCVRKPGFGLRSPEWERLQIVRPYGTLLKSEQVARVTPFWPLSEGRYRKSQHHRCHNQRSCEHHNDAPHLFLTSSPFSPKRKPAYLSLGEIAGCATSSPRPSQRPICREAGFLASISANQS